MCVCQRERERERQREREGEMERVCVCVCATWVSRLWEQVDLQLQTQGFGPARRVFRKNVLKGASVT